MIRPAFQGNLRKRQSRGYAVNGMVARDGLVTVASPRVSEVKTLDHKLHQRKNIVMLELTVPWEEQIEEVSQRKREKYQDLVSN